MVLQNVTLRWVNHLKPDAYDKLTMDIFLDGDQQLAMQGAGLTLKNDEDGVYYRFSYAPTTKDGNPVTIPIKDRFGVDFTGKIPNGTTADVDFYTYEWTFQGKTGTKARVSDTKLLGDVIPVSALSYDTPEEA